MPYTKNSWNTGDIITAAKLNHMEDGIAASDLSESVKTALLQIAAKVAYIDDQGQEYYDALEEALYPDKTLTGIGAAYDQSGSVYPTTSLDSLKSDLTVTAYYDDGSTAAVTTYTLSGTLAVGTSTVTVTYSGFTDTFDVTVSAAPTVSSISAVYTQSGTVYETDTLDSLKSDLVVTATYSDSSTATVPAADYTLSGTLTVGTSTITVSYEGKTTTFNVTVTQAAPSYVTDGLFAHWDAIDNQATGTHDSNATTWVDKVNAHTWSAMTTDGTQTWSWDTDALIFNTPSPGSSGTNGKNTFMCNRPGTGLRTLEIVFETTYIGCLGEFTSDITGVTDNTTQIVATVASDNTVVTQGSQSSTFAVGSLGNIKSIAATYDSSYAPVKAYMNGTEITNRGSTHSFKYHHYSDMILGAQNNATSLTYGFKGRIHAIRFYSKELSASEVAQNYAVDADRFSLS